jgi:hypothetical protein
MDDGHEAKAQFQKNWDAWKAWAKLEEMRPGCRCRSSHPSHGGRLLCDALEFPACFPKRTFRCLFDL